jgi:hypothetical protein
MAIYLAFSIIIFISIAKGNSKSFKKYLTLAASCLLALSAIIVILINTVLLFKLNPSLQTPIMPSNIHMGFISERELNNMKGVNDDVDLSGGRSINGHNDEFIGKLSDLLESKNKTIGYKNLLGLHKFYWLTYRVNIECPNRFYKDCISPNASNLTIDIKYLEGYFNDDWPYPSWNCVINTENAKCASNCTELISANYSLILFQRKRDYDTSDDTLIEPAWAGLSKYNIQPKFELVHNSSINPCSDSSRLFAGSFLKYLSLSLFTVSLKFYL